MRKSPSRSASPSTRRRGRSARPQSALAFELDEAEAAEFDAKLAQALDDVLKIQQKGKAKIRAAEQEMARMEQDLKKKLLEIQH